MANQETPTVPIEEEVDDENWFDDILEERCAKLDSKGHDKLLALLTVEFERKNVTLTGQGLGDILCALCGALRHILDPKICEGVLGGTRSQLVSYLVNEAENSSPPAFVDLAGASKHSTPRSAPQSDSQPSPLSKRVQAEMPNTPNTSHTSGDNPPELAGTGLSRALSAPTNTSRPRVNSDEEENDSPKSSPQKPAKSVSPSFETKSNPETGHEMDEREIALRAKHGPFFSRALQLAKELDAAKLESKKLEADHQALLESNTQTNKELSQMKTVCEKLTASQRDLIKEWTTSLETIKKLENLNGDLKLRLDKQSSEWMVSYERLKNENRVLLERTTEAAHTANRLHDSQIRNGQLTDHTSLLEARVEELEREVELCQCADLTKERDRLENDLALLMAEYDRAQATLNEKRAQEHEEGKAGGAETEESFNVDASDSSQDGQTRGETVARVERTPKTPEGGISRQSTAGELLRQSTAGNLQIGEESPTPKGFAMRGPSDVKKLKGDKKKLEKRIEKLSKQLEGVEEKLEESREQSETYKTELELLRRIHRSKTPAGPMTPSSKEILDYEVHTLNVERETMTKEVAKLQGERDHEQQSLDGIRNDRKAIGREVKSLKEVKQLLTKSTSKLGDELSALQEQRETLAKERAGLEKQCDELRDRRGALEKDFDASAYAAGFCGNCTKVMKGQMVVEMKNAELEAQNDELAKSLKDALLKAESLEKQLQQLKNELKDANTKLFQAQGALKREQGQMGSPTKRALSAAADAKLGPPTDEPPSVSGRSAQTDGHSSIYNPNTPFVSPHHEPEITGTESLPLLDLNGKRQPSDGDSEMLGVPPRSSRGRRHSPTSPLLAPPHDAPPPVRPPTDVHKGPYHRQGSTLTSQLSSHPPTIEIPRSVGSLPRQLSSAAPSSLGMGPDEESSMLLGHDGQLYVPPQGRQQRGQEPEPEEDPPTCGCFGRKKKKKKKKKKRKES